MEKSLTDEYISFLGNNFELVRSKIKNAGEGDAVLCAATKTVPVDIINYAIDNLGLSVIGENRVQELLSKYDGLHRDKVRLHFIGRLQKNKVKYIVDKVDLIESVDSPELAEVIDRCCKKIGKVMDILVEINIGDEESKGGVRKEEVRDLIAGLEKLENIRVAGLMVIPPPSSDEDYKKYFSETFGIFIDIFGNKIHNSSGYVLSMGMSDSYEIAAQCGATEVRVGSALFGKRDYVQNN